jgi:alkylhydroperoxidase family enzyme
MINPMSRTLEQSLKPASTDWKTLHARYNPLLNLVKELIGIIPNCDPTLEIWPPGFRTYNLLVPNMFNLPNTLFGSKSLKASMGLAMYASSKAACAYCTAHTCSFALRRGARAEAIAGVRTEKEQAVVRLAERLAHIPSTLTLADVEVVRQYFSSSETEWLVYAISMMGFLNKFMNAVGVELEQEAINDTAELLSKTGWTPGIHASKSYRITKSDAPQVDNLLTYLRVIRHAPGAVLWEKKWTRGVPSDYSSAAEYLKRHTGYTFPILKPIKEGRVVRTLATSLRDNLNKENTVAGLKIKVYAGYIFSTLVQNEVLRSEIKNLSTTAEPGLKDDTLNKLADIAQMELPTDNASCKEVINSFQQKFSLTEKDAATLLLAVAASHSPAQINDAVIELSMKHMEPAGIVEIVVWLSVLQLLNRLSSYYTLTKAY